ncbi:MAG: hypothetical protein H6737_29255 [Alphaproteobacteria bacterium]|nr:hypothetical protein [Alphaproteobacteria bacterium]
MRIAWTLLSGGVKIRREVLDAARKHVLYHVPPGTPLPHAEDRAAYLTRQFIAQARGRTVEDPWPGDAAMPLTERWARAIEAIRDRLTDSVFRMHYGDQRPLEYVERKLGIDRIAVDAARGGLREVLRRAARADGLPLDSWPNDRLDRVLARLASFAPDHCPPMYDVVNGAHHTHVRTCPRCNRMVRLVNAGALEVADLQPPTLRARPRETARVLALHFHPDGRMHRARVQEALKGATHPVGEDLLLVDATDTDAVAGVLNLAAEVGMPERHHLRGALLEGPGEWTRFGPLGPLAANARLEVKSRSWGRVDGLGALPEVLPAPPPAHQAWMLVSMLAAAAGLALWFAATTASPPIPGPEVEFVRGSSGTWAHFDVEESRTVHLIGLASGAPEPVLLSKNAADKAGLAVGDGSYRALVPGDQALLIAADDTLDLAPLLSAAGQSRAPLATLSAEVRRIQPTADVFLFPR